MESDPNLPGKEDPDGKHGTIVPQPKRSTRTPFQSRAAGPGENPSASMGEAYEESPANTAGTEPAPSTAETISEAQANTGDTDQTSTSYYLGRRYVLAPPSTELQKARIICVIGGPGVGKGTQCTRLAQDLDAVHVSVGDLLRAKAEKLLEEHNIDAKGHMKGGTLCPAEVVQGELENHLLKNIGDGNCKFLVDGFPRSKEQMDLFTDRGRKVNAVLFFDGSEETMLKRMLNRAKTSDRVDDNVETFAKRYQGFVDESSKVISVFRAQEILIRLDCERSLAEIYGGLRTLVENILAMDSITPGELQTIHMTVFGTRIAG